MEYKFTRSIVVIGQLARESARTPPSEEDPPFAYIDQSLTILGRTLDTHGERLRQEFLGQRAFIATQFKEFERKVDGQFQEVDGRFKEFEKNMDDQVKDFETKVDGRFKEVDGRLKEVDGRIEELDKKMRQRFGHMQRASWNFLRIRGWEQIYPVGTFDAQGGIHTPERFPRTVKRFWCLKDPSQMDQLIDLLRFYGVQGYEEWDMDADSLEENSDSDESAKNSSRSSVLPIPLEVAVRSHPIIAHRALAAQLGLTYDGIKGFMDRAQELSHTRAERRKKRGQHERTSQERKRRSSEWPPEEEGTEVTSPTDPLSSQGRSR